MSRTLADRFRDHAAQMSPGLYQVLLNAFADDWEVGGIVRSVCRDWENAPSGAVVQLRLLGAVQRLVLRREEPALAMYYPNLGGTAAPDGAWPEFEAALRRHAEELRAELAVAPQTNEPGRSVALLVGLFDAVRRSGLTRVRLLEPGASAGLNLLVDRFRIGGEGWSAGPVASPLQLPDAVIGAVSPVSYEVIERRGCDLAPIDATSQEGRLRLTSFVWPHHLERHERLKAALKVAAAYPVRVDEAGAADWLRQQLAEPPTPGVLTIVWHSVTSQYWPESEVAAIAGLIAEAGTRMPIAQIAMEHPLDRPYAEAELTVQLRGPGLESDLTPRRVAVVADHGIPVTV